MQHPKAGMGMALLAAAFLMGGPAAAASFDCAKASAPDEKAICDSRELSELDVKMATLFDLLTGLVGMGQRGALQDDQTVWLAERHQCGADVPCLRGAYKKRIAELESVYADIKSRGPY